MVQKRVRNLGTGDKLMLKVLDEVAKELGTSRSRLSDGLVQAGLRDVIKSASAEIPFESAVRAGVAGSEAHSEQVKRSNESRLAWTPKDQYAEDKVQKPLRLGINAKRVTPTFVHEGVQVDSRVRQDSVYLKALRAIINSVQSGAVSAAEIRGVLGEVSEYDKEIIDFTKWLDKWDVDFQKAVRAQEDWIKNWNETMRKHEHTIEG